MNHQLFRMLYQPYKWLIFFPLLVIDTIVLATIAVLASVFVSQKAGTLVGVLWARVNAYLTPVFVSVEGLEHLNKNTSYIIVPNHQSHYDIFLMYGWLGVDFKWVMKKELRKVPALGVACEKIGHIFLDRTNHKEAVATLEDAKKKIVNGTSVVMFPEGTRSKTGELASFKKGAFRLAFDLDLPILPVTLVGTRNVLPPDTAAIFPGKVKMIIHPPVDIKKYSLQEIDKLMSDVKATIKSGL